MKKIMLFLFTILVSFMMFGGVSAEELNCKYKIYDDNDDDYYISFKFKYSEKGEYESMEVICFSSVDGNDCSKWSGFEYKSIDFKKPSCPPYLKEKEAPNGNLGLSAHNVKSSSVAQLESLNKNVSCLQYKTESSCKTSKTHACVWVENEETSSELYESGETPGFCNVDNLLYVACGNARDIPAQVPAIISLIVNLLKIATPIILIFVSVISLLKALAAQKEDEIKKAQSGMIRRVIAAVLVFFVISIVQFVIAIVADSEIKDKAGLTENDHFSGCLDCFLNNSCEANKYYKTVISGEDYCTQLSTGAIEQCTLEKK